MVFQRQYHSTLCRFGEALRDTVGAPPEGIVLRVTWDRWFLAATIHEFVERGDGSPAPRVQPDTGYAQSVRGFDTLDRVRDMAITHRFFRRNEVLMDRQANEIDTGSKRRALQPLQILVFLAFQLLMQNIDPGNAETRRFLYHRFYRDFRLPKMPIRIRGKCQTNNVVHKIKPVHAL